MKKLVYFAAGVLLAALVPAVADNVREGWNKLEFTTPIRSASGNIAARKMVDDFKEKMRKIEAGLDMEAKIRKCEIDLSDLRAVLRNIDPDEKVDNIDCRKLVTGTVTMGGWLRQA